MSEREANFQKIQQRIKDLMEQNMDVNDVRIQPPSHGLEKTLAKNKETTQKNPPPKTEGVIQPIKKTELEELAEKEFNEFLIEPLKTKDTVEKIFIRKKLMEVLGSAIYPLVPDTTQMEEIESKKSTAKPASKNESQEFKTPFKTEISELKTNTEVLKKNPVEMQKPPKQDNQLNLREMLEIIEQMNNLTSKLKEMISETYGRSHPSEIGLKPAPPPPPPTPPPPPPLFSFRYRTPRQVSYGTTTRRLY